MEFNFQLCVSILNAMVRLSVMRFSFYTFLVQENKSGWWIIIILLHDFIYDILHTKDRMTVKALRSRGALLNATLRIEPGSTWWNSSVPDHSTKSEVGTCRL